MAAIQLILPDIALMFVQQITAQMRASGLDNTALQDSVEAVPDGDKLHIYLNHYGRYVISGRRKFVKKVPISALLGWIKKNNIQPRNRGGKAISQNSLAWAIQISIYKNGIRGRDFLTPALAGAVDEAAKMIEQYLVQEVDIIVSRA